ncbi:MAG TPA: DegV family protein [Frankiaceae bacterium]|nr:DegV family protein [Frankiaceae bacterium]
MPVAVVTDSTAYLPDGLARRHGIAVVPLHVIAGGRSGLEGVEVSPDDVRRELGERRAAVTTSQPAPGQLLEAYTEAAKAGADAVVSVHLSAKLSGTYAAARRTAEQAPLPVRVVDSRGIAMGLGFPVLEAATAASHGASAEEVAGVALRAVERTRTFFYVDTLEHLRRGGRIGAAHALLGTALSVKPILHILNGEIVSLERARTASRAIARLEELVEDAAADLPVDLAVHHLGTPLRAAALAGRLRERVHGLGELHLSEVGAVVGAHVGAGLLAVVVHRR